MTEEEMHTAEEEIPKLAVMALQRAYQKAIESGNDVIIKIGNGLYKVNKFGKREFIKETEPSMKMKKGTIIKITAT